MTENQKLREALLSDMDIAVLRMPVRMAFAGDMAQFQYHNRVQSLLNRIDALALPTADHLPDAGKMVVDHFPDATKMIETAAPGCELERFEAWWRSVQLMTFPKEYDTKRLQDWGSIYKPKALEAWQARAALSDGDAVDAQRYRWLADCLNYPEAVTLISDGSLTEDALGKAIDAAMRKDTP